MRLRGGGRWNWLSTRGCLQTSRTLIHASRPDTYAMQGQHLKRRLLSMCATLLAFAGPCLPQGYFSDLLANAGVALVGAVLSDILAAVSPPI